MYHYELYDENGETIACGSCEKHNADTASELCFSEIDNLEQIYDCQRDKGEPGCWSYVIIGFVHTKGISFNDDQVVVETFTVTIK